MEQELNQHLLHTLHFRPLLKDSFKQSGPEAFNTDGNFCVIDDTLSLTDKLNLEKFYKSLPSTKTNDKVYLDLEDKLKQMMNERNNLYNQNYDNCEMVNKVFCDKFINFLTDYTNGFLVALKLDDNTFKYVNNIKSFDYTFKLYKIMFPQLKIDLEKSQLIGKTFRNKSTKESLNEMLENAKYVDNFVNFNVNFEKIIYETFSYYDIINKINQYNILTLTEINNIPKIFSLNNKINQQVSSLNELIEELNQLSTLKLKNISIDSEFNNTKSEQIKSNNIKLINESEKINIDELKFEESLTFKRLKNIRDKGLYNDVDIEFDKLLLDNINKKVDETGDYNAVLYNKHFNRIILCEYFKLFTYISVNALKFDFCENY
jgi:hypothetical protein